MTYYGILDICLHFHGFRNVDLFHQGLYRLQSRVYYDASRHSTSGSFTRKTLYSRGMKTVGVEEEDYERDLSLECIVGFPYAFASGESRSKSTCAADFCRFNTTEYVNRDINVSRHTEDSIPLPNQANTKYPPLTIIPEHQSCLTSAFNVQHPYQEVEINELCQFRLEFDLCKEGALVGPVYVEIDLLFAPLSPCDLLESNGSSYETKSNFTEHLTSNDRLNLYSTPSDFFNSRVSNVTQDSEKHLRTQVSSQKFSHADQGMNGSEKWKFQSVAFQAYCVHNACQGIHQYLPVIFDEYHFCICNISVHTCLVDIRRRVTSNHLPCFYRPRYRDKYYASAVHNTSLTDPSQEKKSVKRYSLFKKAMNLDASTAPENAPTFIDFLIGGHHGLEDFIMSYVNFVSEIKHFSPYEEYAQELNSQSVTNVFCLDAFSVSSKRSVVSLPCYQTPKMSAVTCLVEADKLHLQYFCVLLESFCQIYFFSRVLYCRTFTVKERQTLNSMIQFRPLSLPGGSSVSLPGVQDDWIQELNVDNTSFLTSSWVPSRDRSKESKEMGDTVPADTVEIQIRVPTHALLTELYRLSEDSDYDFTKLRSTVQNKKKSIPFIAHIPRLQCRLDKIELHPISSLISRDFQHIAVQLLTLWHQCLSLLPFIHMEIMNILRHTYSLHSRNFWKECIIRETLSAKQLITPLDNSLGETHQNIANQIRQSLRNPFYEYQLITDVFRVPTPDSRPILFEQRYQLEAALQDCTNDLEVLLKIRPMNSVLKKKVHLVVLVHGFQGNAYDMRLLRNVLNAVYPTLLCLCSSMNEAYTEGDVEEMGFRLAIEINQFIQDQSLTFTLSRLSFIAHSLGGVIVRAALLHLKHLWPMLYTFVSLSSPHLGYMYSSNRWVEAGIWFLKKWKRCTALQQLTLSDAKQMEDTFLYRLSTSSKSLKYFRHLCFVSSNQDHYVPFESARVEVSQRAKRDLKSVTTNSLCIAHCPTRLGPTYMAMALNLLGEVDICRLRRFDINFSLIERNFDTMIGRTAHILFLDNSVWMHMFFESYPEFFK